MSKISRARKTMRKALKRDAELFYGYQSNIAMLLHDKYGIKDYGKRNEAAAEILRLVFGIKKEIICSIN